MRYRRIAPKKQHLEPPLRKTQSRESKEKKAADAHAPTSDARSASNGMGFAEQSKSSRSPGSNSSPPGGFRAFQGAHERKVVKAKRRTNLSSTAMPDAANGADQSRKNKAGAYPDGKDEDMDLGDHVEDATSAHMPSKQESTGHASMASNPYPSAQFASAFDPSSSASAVPESKPAFPQAAAYAPPAQTNAPNAFTFEPFRPLFSGAHILQSQQQPGMPPAEHSTNGAPFSGSNIPASSSQQQQQGAGGGMPAAAQASSQDNTHAQQPSKGFTFMPPAPAFPQYIRSWLPQHSSYAHASTAHTTPFFNMPQQQQEFGASTAQQEASHAAGQEQSQSTGSNGFAFTFPNHTTHTAAASSEHAQQASGQKEENTKKGFSFYFATLRQSLPSYQSSGPAEPGFPFIPPQSDNATSQSAAAPSHSASSFHPPQPDNVSAAASHNNASIPKDDSAGGFRFMPPQTTQIFHEPHGENGQNYQNAASGSQNTTGTTAEDMSKHQHATHVEDASGPAFQTQAAHAQSATHPGHGTGEMDQSQQALPRQKGTGAKQTDRRASSSKHLTSSKRVVPKQPGSAAGSAGTQNQLFKHSAIGVCECMHVYVSHAQASALKSVNFASRSAARSESMIPKP